MKPTILYILVILNSIFGFAQTDTLEVESKVKSVILYPQGAQVTREINYSPPQGKSVLVFKDLPYHMNANTLQIGCDKLQHILSFQDVKETGGFKTNSPELLTLKKDKQSIELKIKQADKQIQLLQMKQDLLLKNNQLNSKTTTIPLEELKKTVAYFDNKMKTIENDRLNTKQEKETLSKKLKAIDSQIFTLSNKREKDSSKLLVTINNTTYKPVKYTISYYLSHAGWAPNYNLRVDHIDQPLIADYHASVYQNTGEDWKDINLTLAIMTPDLSESNATLEKWVLERKKKAPKKKKIESQYNTPKSKISLTYTSYSNRKSGFIKGTIYDVESEETIPMANVVVKSGQTVVQGGISDFDGNYMISPLDFGTYTIEISFIGYNTRTVREVIISKNEYPHLDVYLQEDDGLLYDVVLEYETPIIDSDKTGTIIPGEDIPNTSIQSIIDKIVKELKDDFTYPEFNLNSPTTILSHAEHTDVKIKSINIPTHFNYQSIPKLQKHVYLEAGIPNWNTYHFIPGKANIYLKGQYVGQTHLNTDHFSDTLNLELGKDSELKTKRVYEEHLSEKITTGNKIKETITYSILVKNDKPVPANLTVKDQIPISTSKEVTIELLEGNGGELDKETGTLTWDIKLKPKESKKITFTYLVKYQKYE